MRLIQILHKSRNRSDLPIFLFRIFYLLLIKLDQTIDGRNDELLRNNAKSKIGRRQRRDIA